MRERFSAMVSLLLVLSVLLPACAPKTVSDSELATAVASALSATKTVEAEIQTRVQATLDAGSEAEPAPPTTPTPPPEVIIKEVEVIVTPTPEALAPTQLPAPTEPPVTPTVMTPTSVTGVVAEAQIQATTGGIVKLYDKTRIAIPPSALETDQRVAISLVDSKPVGDEGSLFLPGQVYEISFEQEVFNSPIQITLLYEKELLPVNRTEDDIFAIFLHKGEWQRIYGKVDKWENTITVDTMHNGVWTWAVDKIDNIVQCAKVVFGKEKQTIDSLAEARELVEETRQEFIDAWHAADFTVERLGSYLDPRTVLGEIGGAIALEAADAVAIGLGGKQAVLIIGGHTVAAWGGAVLTGIYIGKIAGWSALTVEKVTRLHLAGKRYEEAKAILWIKEHPKALTIPPQYAEALRRVCKSVLEDGLVAYYPFNGNADDESGNGNHGTVHGATLTTDRDGNDRSAYRFDGSEDAIILGDVLDDVFAGPDKKFSIDFWTKINELPDDVQAVFIGKMGDSAVGPEDQRQFTVSLWPDGYLVFHYRASLSAPRAKLVRADPPLDTGVWYHIAVVYNGSVDTNDGLDRVSIYVNGVSQATSLVGAEAPLGDIQDGLANLAIGAAVASNLDIGYPFNGLIDDVRIFDRALSASEIKAIH
jgi:hypothetical protein